MKSTNQTEYICLVYATVWVYKQQHQQTHSPFYRILTDTMSSVIVASKMLFSATSLFPLPTTLPLPFPLPTTLPLLPTTLPLLPTMSKMRMRMVLNLSRWSTANQKNPYPPEPSYTQTTEDKHDSQCINQSISKQPRWSRKGRPYQKFPDWSIMGSESYM